MFKYFLVLLVAGGVIYAAQHPDLLERLQLQDGPDLKVWVSQTHVSLTTGSSTSSTCSRARASPSSSRAS